MKILRFHALRAPSSTPSYLHHLFEKSFNADEKKVQVGKDEEKTQSEKDSQFKNRGGKKNKLIIRYLYHETYRKPNEQLFSQ